MSESNAIDNNTIEALKEIMGDTFNLLISTFTDDTGQLVQSLTELQQQNNLEVFTRNAHSIKSSSANVGALQLSSIAAELEGRGKSGDIANTNTLIEQLTSEFSHVCSELNGLN